MAGSGVVRLNLTKLQSKVSKLKGTTMKKKEKSNPHRKYYKHNPGY